MEGLVLMRHDNRVIKRGSPATNVFIKKHPELTNEDIYDTHIIVQIIEEGL